MTDDLREGFDPSEIEDPDDVEIVYEVEESVQQESAADTDEVEEIVEEVEARWTAGMKAAQEGDAEAYRRLLTEYQMTQAELADNVSKSRSAITRRAGQVTREAALRGR